MHARQATPGWDHGAGPESRNIDQIAVMAPEPPSVRVHERVPSANIYSFNASIHNRDGIAVSTALNGKQGGNAWLLAGAFVAVFGLGWAGGWSSHYFLDFDAANNQLPQKVKSSHRIPDSERRSFAKGGLRNTASEASLPATGTLKLTTPAASVAGNVYKPSLGAAHPRDDSSITASSAEPANTATQRDATVKPETRPTTIEGWTVRDVRGGTAFLEGPDGVRTATRGDMVPGVGRIDSIVRWGNRWIVATTTGLIATP
jgi:hypothetical protein